MSRARRTPAERCRDCGALVMWATLDATSRRAGRRIALDLIPSDGGTIEVYWGGGRGNRFARVHPRGTSADIPLRRPHFATCPLARRTPEPTFVRAMP